MTIATRRLLLRANALFLGIASIAAFLLLDLRGIVFGAGPAGQALAAPPRPDVDDRRLVSSGAHRAVRNRRTAARRP